MDDRSWKQAQLGIASVGLGLRCVATHAPAAYLASLLGASELCSAIDPSFVLDEADNGLQFGISRALLMSAVCPEAALDLTGSSHRQKYLSSLVDARLREALVTDQMGDPSFLAHLALQGLPGAGVWLTAPPVEDGRKLMRLCSQSF